MEEIRVPAAQYLRMSTERQDFSITHQRLAIAAYAAAHGLEVVETFADEGVSGLGVDKRTGLKSLLARILSGSAGFETVLVYDVSRWGRFQNPDQAAHYEFLCSEGGVSVVYCAEEFSNDGTLSSVLLKNVKRIMAAEYSRDLSEKVHRAQRTLAIQGYWQGGPPGYGLRRQQIKPDGALGRVLESGDIKGAGNGRTILVPGPPDEVAVVRRIFELRLRQNKGYRAIAALLNADGVPFLGGRPWLAGSVQGILTSERYAGANVVGKTVRRMGKKPRRAPAEEWTRRAGAFEPIVDPRTFRTLQRRQARRCRRYTDGEILENLRSAWSRRGKLNIAIITSDPDLPAPAVFQRRFGSLAAAYALIGYVPTPKQAIGLAALSTRQDAIRRHPTDALSSDLFLETLRSLLERHGRLTAAIIDQALGRWTYRAGARRFGGGRRMYALAGYRPNPRQALTFNASASETVTEAEAEELRLLASALDRPQPPGPEPSPGCGAQDAYR